MDLRTLAGQSSESVGKSKGGSVQLPSGGLHQDQIASQRFHSTSSPIQQARSPGADMSISNPQLKTSFRPNTAPQHEELVLKARNGLGRGRRLSTPAHGSAHLPIPMQPPSRSAAASMRNIKRGNTHSSGRTSQQQFPISHDRF